jgi:transcriptional regulator with XRE-family HTH domain
MKQKNEREGSREKFSPLAKKVIAKGIKLFAERVVEFRETLGLSQRETARRAGMSQCHLSAVENGKKMLGFRRLVLLARALETTVEKLIGPSFVSRHDD